MMNQIINEDGTCSLCPEGTEPDIATIYKSCIKIPELLPELTQNSYSCGPREIVIYGEKGDVTCKEC